MNTVPDDQDEVKSPNLRMSRLGLVRPRTEFARNILTLVTGTSVAQVLPLLAMPILSRMYTKEDFGNYNLFVSLASLLAILVSGRYELAVMLPKDDEDAVNIFSLSMWLGGIFCSIALVVSILFHEQILTLLKAPDFGIWLFFVPPMAVLTVCYQTYNYWFNRFQLYRRLSINRVTRNGLVTGSKLALGARAAAKPLFVGGLIIGEVVGQLLALLTFWRHFRIEHKDIARRISRDRMMSVLRRYRAFPFYTVPADLVNELSRRLPTFFIIPTFGTAINGEFSLTLLALGVPLSLVASAFADVFKQRAAVAFNEHGNCVAAPLGACWRLCASTYALFLSQFYRITAVENSLRC
jgi:O-antigen/teichoic acid export membrane protein